MCSQQVVHRGDVLSPAVTAQPRRPELTRARSKSSLHDHAAPETLAGIGKDSGFTPHS